MSVSTGPRIGSAVARAPLALPSTIATSQQTPTGDVRLFCVFAGFIVTTVYATSIVTNWPGKTVTTQWMAIGVGVPIYMSIFALTRRLRIPSWLRLLSGTLQFLLACAFVACGLSLAILGHRYILIAVAIVQAFLIFIFLQTGNRPRIPTLTLVVMSFVSWIAAAPLSYTALNNLTLDASTSSNFVIFALVGALVVSVYDLVKADYDPVESDFGARAASSSRSGRFTSAILFTVAGLTFLELSLRTDGLLTDWIPYHRSYFTEPATFVRLGHWLLWDVPSQYGFLSVLAVAMAPGATTLQASYVLTAIILTVQSLMYFVMIRSGAHSLHNALLALVLPATMFLGDQAYRWPFGPRVYPQHGIRFFWIYALLFVVFQLSSNPTSRSRRVWLVLGYGAWGLGCFWAFESAIWSTLIWGTYLGSIGLAKALSRRTVPERINVFLPLLVLPAIATVCVAGIDAYYSLRLGHLPDWRAYVEFSAIYLGAAPNSPMADRLGPGWILLVLLGGIGTPLLLAISRRKWSAIPPLATCWVAAWSICIYYAGEAFNNHVNAIAGVFGFAFVTIGSVARNEELAGAPMFVSRATFVPVVVLFVATELGNGGSFLRGHAPLLPGYRFDQTDRVPTISGELAALMRTAGVSVDDKVVLPDAIGWVKIDSGLIMPFVRDAEGHPRELEPWLPLQPGGGFGAYDTLTADRQQVYIDRYLGVGHGAGWLIAYHEPARCSTFAPQTRNQGQWNSANFSMTRCVMPAHGDVRGERK